MRENRINWPQFFRPVCVLCMVCGGLWLWWQMSLTENLLGRITTIAGGVLFLLGGLFGLLGKPRALVPLLDFLALAASLFALWKIGLCWQAIAGVVLSALYLICCNASTAIGDDGDAKEQPDYSEPAPLLGEHGEGKAGVGAEYIREGQRKRRKINPPPAGRRTVRENRRMARRRAAGRLLPDERRADAFQGPATQPAPVFTAGRHEPRRGGDR